MIVGDCISYKKCTGFTLIEVLVAALVMSVGLLGLAGLQMTSLKNTHAAAMTSEASILASSMADRVRANPNSYSTTDWLNDLASTFPSGTGAVTEDSSDCRVDNDNNGYLVQIWWDKNQDAQIDKPYEICFYHEE